MEKLCSECQEPIPYRRAELPGVNTCIECQEDLERLKKVPRFKMYFEPVIEKGWALESIETRLVKE